MTNPAPWENWTSLAVLIRQRIELEMVEGQRVMSETEREELVKQLVKRVSLTITRRLSARATHAAGDAH